MSDTYFQYTLSKCRSILIRDVCLRFSTRKKLIESTCEEWHDYPRISRNYELLDAVYDLFRYGELSHISEFNGDSKIIYNRCKNIFMSTREKIQKGGSLDYDRLFDNLVDLCWLLSSIHNSKQHYYRGIILLSDSNQIRESIKHYLDNTYDLAIDAHNEGVYISEGIKARKEHPLIHALYDYQYEKSKKYILGEWTIRDLESEKREQERKCSLHLALYYGLTATAALANNYDRGLF